MNLGENIYRLRTERNMSQGDLADALDVSRQSVSKWENNSSTPELEKLIKMSELFGITLDALVSGTSPLPETVSAETPKPERNTINLRQIFGVVLICLAVILIIVSFVFSDYWMEAGIYFALLLATAGIGCCWPFKLTVLIGIFALDAIFLLVLAVFGAPQSAMILSIPFVAIYAILAYQNAKE